MSTADSSFPTWQRIFVALRGLLWSAGFVALWTWLAVWAQSFDARLPFTIPGALRIAGTAVAAIGALLAASCIVTFIARGRGTPAPFDPPREFVASGPYRFVRNPMYIGGAAVLLGAGLIVASPAIIILAVLFLALMHLIVAVYEEPVLTSSFGDSYRRYKASVNRWLPRKP